MFAAQALGSSPIAAAFADDRGISRVEAVDRRRVARGRRPLARRPRDRRRARDRRRHRRRRRGRDRGEHRAARRARPASKPTARAAPRSARSSQAVARGEIAPGSRVVLVVTGARPEPVESDVAARSRRSTPTQTPSSPHSASARSDVADDHGRPAATPPPRSAATCACSGRSSARCSSSRRASGCSSSSRRSAATRGARARDGTIASTASSLTAEQQALVLRAFGLYFQLANLAEQHHRLRRRREDAHDGVVARESLDDAFGQLAAVPAEELAARAATTSIRLVLTAHPTEATRRTRAARAHPDRRAARAPRRPAARAGRAGRGRGAARRGGDAALADRRGAARPAADHRRDPPRALVLRAQPDLGRDRPAARLARARARRRRRRSRSARGSAATWTATRRPGRRRSPRRSTRRARVALRALPRRGARARGRDRLDPLARAGLGRARGVARPRRGASCPGTRPRSARATSSSRTAASSRSCGGGSSNDGYRRAGRAARRPAPIRESLDGERRPPRRRRARRAARADGRALRLPRREARRAPARARPRRAARARGGRGGRRRRAAGTGRRRSTR